jgi:hypothetical protein
MARLLTILVAFVALSAWAGAQGPPAPAQLSPEDRIRLLKSNSLLISHLVDEGVRMANAADSVDRAAGCRGAGRSLVNAIDQAAAAGDAERAAVLAGLYRQVVAEGLVPTIKDASGEVRPESPRGKVLQQVRTDAAKDLTDLKAALGKSDKLTGHPRVRDEAEQLDKLGETLKLGEVSR